MSTTASPKRPPANRPLMPDAETFWRKYSPRHEFPLSTSLSLFLHGLAIGLILIVGYLAKLGWDDRDKRPPEIQVVEVTGDPGDPGGGGPAGLPGDGVRPAEVEFPRPKDAFSEFVPTTPMDVTPTPVELDPSTILPSDFKDDPLAKQILEKLKSASKDPVEKKVAEVTDPKVPRFPGVDSKKGGTGGEKGALGKGGKGFGPGSGDGVGPGSGKGGTGRPMTRQEYLARRWNFGLEGSPKVHLDKLMKVGFIVGLDAADGSFYSVIDLKSRPVQIKIDNLNRYRDAVQWENTKVESVVGLIREMGLKMPVKRVLLLLPQDREEKIHQEEVRYAKEIGRPKDSFQHIWFDFEMRGGNYEPKAFKVAP